MTVFKKYGIWEYFLIIIGMVLLTKQTWAYIVDKLEFEPLELIVFLVGVLLVSAPNFLVSLVKKYSGKLTDKQ